MAGTATAASKYEALVLGFRSDQVFYLNVLSDRQEPSARKDFQALIISHTPISYLACLVSCLPIMLRELAWTAFV